MGKDISHRFDRKAKRTAPRSKNIYLKLLVKLYTYLARKTDAKFNKIILKRLFMSKIYRPPLSLSRIVRLLQNQEDKTSKIIVAVAKITDDIRYFEMIQGLKICALNFTKTARERLEKNGGECLTFDQLAKISPKGKNTILVQGKRKARTACKYMGKAPGLPRSHTRPRVRSKGLNFERARGRRKSCGYKK